MSSTPSADHRAGKVLPPHPPLLGHLIRLAPPLAIQARLALPPPHLLALSVQLAACQLAPAFCRVVKLAAFGLSHLLFSDRPFRTCSSPPFLGPLLSFVSSSSYHHASITLTRPFLCPQQSLSNIHPCHSSRRQTQHHHHKCSSRSHSPLRRSGGLTRNVLGFISRSFRANSAYVIPTRKPVVILLGLVISGLSLI